MSAAESIVHVALIVTLAAPLGLLAILGIPTLLGRPLGEAAIGRATRLLVFGAFAAAGLAFTVHAASGAGPRIASFGLWFGDAGHGFALDVLVDRVSLGFVTVALALCGVDGAFAYRYLHREPGFNRYFVLYAMFTTGITAIALAGSIEVLFAGWELLGLSSALLIGFFHERRAPVDNAARVFAVYRLSDAAMLAAAVLMHHFTGAGSLTQLVYHGGAAATGLGGAHATIIAGLLLLAIVGKSGLVPLSGWLPRAMEGPTSSSAVFYGSLSIHAGCYLLLRIEPLLEHAPVIRGLTIAAGLVTAIHATVVARVQTDVKSALTYAALTQVGLIVVEIGLGFTTLAFIHIVGHACYRMLQFLSAPNVLHDLHELENALGEPVFGDRRARSTAGRVRRRLYLLALERGFLDAAIDRFVVAPFVALTTVLDRIDRFSCGSARERGRD